MGEFKIIETQEELDALIKDRIERERKSLSEKYSDYEELKKKNTEYDAQVSKLSEANKALEASQIEFKKSIDDLNSKIKSYETDSAKTRIALEMGLPYEIATRLSGTNEEEIRKDAEGLAKYVNKPEPAPVGSNEPIKYAELKDESLKQLVRSMSKE